VAEVTIRLKPIYDAKPAAKEAATLTKELREHDKLSKTVSKTFNQIGRQIPTAFNGIERAANSMGRAIHGAFDGASHGIDRFNRGIDSLTHKLLSVKTLVAGLAVAKIGSSIFGEAKTEAGAKARLTREFGAESEYLEKLAKGSARRSGLSTAETLSALAVIGEATATTQEGTLFRGKKLTAKQALEVRKQTTKTGLQLFERLAALSPDIEPQLLAESVAAAGTGPEGMRRLISELRLNPALSRPLVEAAEKGRLYEKLTPQERTKFGVTKGTGFMGGTMLEILLSRRGLTEEAADATRRKTSFQMRAVQSLIKDDEARAGEKLFAKTQGLFKGTSLMDRYEQVRDFAEQHATGLGALAAGYLGVRSYGAIKGMFGGGGAGGALGTAEGMLGGGGEGLGGGGVVPVRVVNLPGVSPTGSGALSIVGKVSLLAAAAGVGYEVGTALENATGGRESTSISKFLHENRVARFLFNMDYVDKIIGVERPAGARGEAHRFNESKPIFGDVVGGERMPPVTVHVNMPAPAQDPAAYVAWLLPHIGRQMLDGIQRSSAGGAAPVSRAP